jgi:hypothetical protein
VEVVFIRMPMLAEWREPSGFDSPDGLRRSAEINKESTGSLIALTRSDIVINL